MNEKDVATRLRRIAERDYVYMRREVTKLADELDLPIPAPGTPILWRHDPTLTWKHGVVERGGVVRDVNGHWTYLANMQWKPARIAGENEAAVNREDLVNVLGYYAGSHIITDTKKSAQASLQSLFEALGEAVDD